MRIDARRGLLVLPSRLYERRLHLPHRSAGFRERLLWPRRRAAPPLHVGARGAGGALLYALLIGLRRHRPGMLGAVSRRVRRLVRERRVRELLERMHEVP